MGSVAVAKDGENLSIKVCGFADVENNKKKRNSKYRIVQYQKNLLQKWF
jgi:hypothetical protein